MKPIEIIGQLLDQHQPKASEKEERNVKLYKEEMEKAGKRSREKLSEEQTKLEKKYNVGYTAIAGVNSLSYAERLGKYYALRRNLGMEFELEYAVNQDKTGVLREFVERIKKLKF